MMNLTFEDKGLLIGIISYPFYKKADDLYKEEFKENLFQDYKKGSAYIFSEKDKKKYQDSPVYVPHAYHLFGEYNLAVLSLTDGYAFGNLVFHQGHIPMDKDKDKICGEDPNAESTPYNYQLISGVGYHVKKDEKNPYLETKAMATFLKEVKDDNLKYPFIGITRLKLNNGLLIGSGMEFIYTIRKKTEEIIQDYSEFAHPFDAFMIDSYGNNELTLVSFSNDLYQLYTFIREIKKLTVNDIKDIKGTNDRELFKSEGASSHLFSNTYTNFGYDLDYETGSPFFYPPVKSEKLIFNCRWEAKPGHEEFIYTNLDEQNGKWSGLDDITQSLTGANSIHSRSAYDFDEILGFIKELRKSEELGIHLRKLRFLFYDKNPIPDTDNKNGNDKHGPSDKSKLRFSKDQLRQLKSNLRLNGVSKLTRERLLKMISRFNDCINDNLFYIYFIELRGYLEALIDYVAETANNKNTSVKEVEKYLIEAISAFESAYYNRFHQSSKMGNLADTNLEYNGGIQQFISCFDFIFKKAVEVISPQNKKEFYNRSPFIYISGFENVSSHKEIVKTNINHLTYPELFGITIFKEACNFIFERIDFSHIGDNPEDESARSKTFRKLMALSERWNNIVYRKDLPEKLRACLQLSNAYKPGHYPSLFIDKYFSDMMISYFIADVYTLNYCFNNNLELLTHYYWKYISQLSQQYNRDGELRKSVFVFMILRLSMLNFYYYPDAAQAQAELMKKEFEPFDPQLASLWHCYYNDTVEIAAVLWENMEKSGFRDFLRHALGWTIYLTMEDFYLIDRLTDLLQVLLKENIENYSPSTSESVNLDVSEILKMIKESPELLNIVSDKTETKEGDDFLKDVFEVYSESRQEEVKRIKELLQKNQLVRPIEGINDPYFIFNLLLAYMERAFELEGNKPGKIVYKGLDGFIPYEERDLIDSLSELMADPQGGIYIKTPETKQAYFALRTTLYKSLWDYTMHEKIKMVDEIIKQQSSSRI